jgi:hypothetical protein
MHCLTRATRVWVLFGWERNNARAFGWEKKKKISNRVFWVWNEQQRGQASFAFVPVDNDNVILDYLNNVQSQIWQR